MKWLALFSFIKTANHRNNFFSCFFQVVWLHMLYNMIKVCKVCWSIKNTGIKVKHGFALLSFKYQCFQDCFNRTDRSTPELKVQPLNLPCACEGWAHQRAGCCRPGRQGLGLQVPQAPILRRPHWAHGRVWSCRRRAGEKVWKDWTGRWAQTSSSSPLRSCYWMEWRGQLSRCLSMSHSLRRQRWPKEKKGKRKWGEKLEPDNNWQSDLFEGYLLIIQHIVKHVGVILSLMGDQDIRLRSEGFICTSHKRGSEQYSRLWHKNIKGYFLVLRFHRDISKVLFFRGSKESFFWISATKDFSLCEGWGWGKTLLRTKVCMKKLCFHCVCACVWVSESKRVKVKSRPSLLWFVLAFLGGMSQCSVL